MQRRAFLVAAGATATALAGCTGNDGRDDVSRDDTGGEGSPDADVASVLDETLRLTTTTSTYDTGLIDEVNLAFEDRFGVEVHAIAQGTGAALETARNGDADVVLVHARSFEDEFLREGYGVNRRDLMFNDFVVVGPEDDPAEVRGEPVADAFDAIVVSEATFVSRGDNSGTHAKELKLWDVAGAEPGGRWYREAGDSMGAVLNQATQSSAYTLADRGTFLSRRADLDLEIHVQGPIEGGSELLANPYGIVVVNPGVHEGVNYDLAMAYVGFLTSPRGQELIEAYTVDGEQLFFPEAIASEPNFQQYLPEDWR